MVTERCFNSEEHVPYADDEKVRNARFPDWTEEQDRTFCPVGENAVRRYRLKIAVSQSGLVGTPIF
jgi:hypothetical protein